MRVPFGRHPALDLTNLPTSHLLWLEQTVNPPLLREVRAELHRRRWGAASLSGGAAPDPEIVAELVRAGYRALARRHHPDRGGDVERMQRVNIATAWLRERLGVLA